MIRYILYRCVVMIPTLVLASIVIFTIIQLPPGDYVETYIGELLASGESVDMARVEYLREEYGLNEPMWKRYLLWIGNFVTGDFGYSFEYERPVAEVVGNRTRVKVVKNKVAPPFRQAEFDIMYGKGISREGSLLDIGVDMDLIKKSGAWYTYEGEQIGQGRENVKKFLIENPDLVMEIQDKVLKEVGLMESDEVDLTEADEDASLDESKLFSKAMREILGPLDSPRYVIEREVEVRTDGFLSSILPRIVGKYFQKKKNVFAYGCHDTTNPFSTR